MRMGYRNWRLLRKIMHLLLFWSSIETCIFLKKDSVCFDSGGQSKGPLSHLLIFTFYGPLPYSSKLFKLLKVEYFCNCKVQILLSFFLKMASEMPQDLMNSIPGLTTWGSVRSVGCRDSFRCRRKVFQFIANCQEWTWATPISQHNISLLSMVCC